MRSPGTMVIFSAIVCMASTARPTAMPARFGGPGRLMRDLLGLAGVFGVLLHVGGHLLHGRGGFLGRGRLLGRALRQLFGTGGTVAGCRPRTFCAAMTASATMVRSLLTIVSSAVPSRSLSDSRRASTVRLPAAISSATRAVALR